jgi:hypothetical protein
MFSPQRPGQAALVRLVHLTPDRGPEEFTKPVGTEKSSDLSGSIPMDAEAVLAHLPGAVSIHHPHNQIRRQAVRREIAADLFGRVVHFSPSQRFEVIVGFTQVGLYALAKIPDGHPYISKRDPHKRPGAVAVLPAAPDRVVNGGFDHHLLVRRQFHFTTVDRHVRIPIPSRRVIDQMAFDTAWNKKQ